MKSTKSTTAGSKNNYLELPPMLARHAGIILFVSAILLYINTLRNGFVLDDSLVITANQYTKQGLKGLKEIFSHDFIISKAVDGSGAPIVQGGRYRPLSIAFFAFVYQIFGEKAIVFHFFQVLWYALLCLVFFQTTKRFLAYFLDEKPALHFALASALLFTFHPVHTEVVCNIKSLDEIFALLFSLLAWQVALTNWNQLSLGKTLLIGLLFTAACFSKENAVIFLLIIPLSLVFIQLSKGQSYLNKDLLKCTAALVTGFLIYFYVRGEVLNWTFGASPMDLINNPFIKYAGDKWVPMNAAEKGMTILLGLGRYIWLCIFPFTLTVDYYPRHIPIGEASNLLVWISLTIYLALAVAIFRNWRKGSYPLTIALLLFALPILLTSNIPFPIGTNIAERFLFMPSIGFSLALMLGISSWLSKNPANRPVFTYGFFVVLLLFGLRIITRNPAFYSNMTLAAADIQTSTNSAKMQNMYASLLLEKGSKSKDMGAVHLALDHFNQALAIHPTYPEALFGRGSAYYLKQDLPNALKDLKQAYTMAADKEDVKRNYMIALRTASEQMIAQNAELSTAESYLNEVNAAYPDDPNTVGLLTQLYSQSGKPEQARQMAAKLKTLVPNDPKIDSLIQALR